MKKEDGEEENEYFVISEVVAAYYIKVNEHYAGGKSTKKGKMIHFQKIHNPHTRTILGPSLVLG